MFRRIAIVLPLFAVAACGSGTDADTDATVTTTAAPVTVMDTTSPTSEPAGESEPTSTTAPTTSTPATPVVVVEGANSTADAVSEYYDAIVANDLSRMWAILDPEMKTGVSRSAWETCIAAQFEIQVDSMDYEENDVYTEDGAVFSTGSGTVRAGGQETSLPVTFEVVERTGGWFAVQPVTDSDRESCINQAAG
jgi:hypothetical protein